jgi:cobalt-precorrin 5A hydrolase
MGLGQAGSEAVIVVGIGSRKGVSAAEVVAAVEAALREHGLGRSALTKLATTEFKKGEAGIFEAGEMMGLEMVVVEVPPLGPADCDISPPEGGKESSLSFKVAGVDSVSEAAALAAAGDGARLAGPHIAVGRVTCAIAFGSGR